MWRKVRDPQCCCLVSADGAEHFVCHTRESVFRKAIEFLGVVYRLTPERTQGGWPVYRP